MRNTPLHPSQEGDRTRPLLFSWFANPIIFITLILLIKTTTHAQQPNNFQPLFTQPLSYIIKHTNAKLTIDGKLNEKAWQSAAWTSDFADIEGDLKPKPALTTKVKMLWNDDYLFIAAELQEPQVWAYQQHHDDVIFRDNDFEVFINPDNTTHRYFEIEVNALNKIFDLFLPKPYRNGGDAVIGWNADGLKSTVHISGTLNKPGDTDKGWTVEMAIPLRSLWIGYPFKPPKEGDIWRINFSRVEWDTKTVNGRVEKLKDAAGSNLPEHNWVWSPQGVVNMHYPERWGYLQFTRSNTAHFTLSYTEKQKNALWAIYYSQKQYQQKYGRYAANFAALGVDSLTAINGKTDHLIMEATGQQFKVWVRDDGLAGVSINDEGLVGYGKRGK